jgi:hypothetical protein
LYDFQKAGLDKKDFGITDVGFIIFGEAKVRSGIVLRFKLK